MKKFFFTNKKMNTTNVTHNNYKKLSFLILFLIVLLIYVTNITSIPNNIILFKNEDLNIKTILGINILDENGQKVNVKNNEIVKTSSNSNEKLEKSTQKLNLQVSFLNKIKLKEISVNIIPETYVVPMGNTVGLKLYTNGVLVVGMSEIETQDEQKSKPYKDTGIEEGDMIVSVDKTEVTCTAELIEEINESNGQEVEIEYVRNGEIHTANMKPIKTSNNEYKIGLWVRDTAAGVGTLSLYEPSTGMFAALGHGISDIDTDELIDIAKGNLVTANIVSIVKGEKGKPGEIRGTLENQTDIGKISKNTNFGVFGKLNNVNILNVDVSNSLKVALRDEIKLGDAKIICSVNNKKKEYDIKIEKLFLNNNENNKSMIIKVTDEELLAETGGIIQGMSGSPIIQNNKFVGAVTHVLVNDPTMGYGVFGDIMIKQMREVN